MSKYKPSSLVEVAMQLPALIPGPTAWHVRFEKTNPQAMQQLQDLKDAWHAGKLSKLSGSQLYELARTHCDIPCGIYAFRVWLRSK